MQTFVQKLNFKNLPKTTKIVAIVVAITLLAGATIGIVKAINRNKIPNGVLAFDFVEEAKPEDFEITKLSDGTYEITKYLGNSKYVKFPDDLGLEADFAEFTITRIGKGAFANNTTIRGVKLSEAIIAVDDEAFMNCTNLETFIGPNMFSSIGNKCFCNCPNLTYVYFPILSSIGDSAFEGDTKITQMYMPIMLESIGVDAFKGTSLSKVASENETYIPDFCEQNEIVLEHFSDIDNDAQKLYQGFAKQ